MQKQMATCSDCFNDYVADYAKDHQCPDFWACGNCGNSYELTEGTATTNAGTIEFICNDCKGE